MYLCETVIFQQKYSGFYGSQGGEFVQTAGQSPENKETITGNEKLEAKWKVKTFFHVQ